MALLKTTIAVPKEVLEAVDRAATELGESRSHLVSRILRAAVRARRDAEISRRLDALFRDPSAVEEQRRMTRDLDAAAGRETDQDW